MTLALAAVAAGVVLALALPNSLDWRSDSPYLDSVKGVVDFREGSGRGRLAQYANSVKMAAAHPLLGVGPGNWPVIYPKFATSNDPSLAETTGMAANPWPSSDWVGALSERGVAAFLALVAFVVLLLGSALKTRYDSARSPDERLAAITGGGVVLIAAIAGGFDAVLLLPTPSIVVWAAAGALLTVPSHHRRRGGFCSARRSRRSRLPPACSANGGSRRCDCTRWERRRRSSRRSRRTPDPIASRCEPPIISWHAGSARRRTRTLSSRAPCSRIPQRRGVFWLSARAE